MTKRHLSTVFAILSIAVVFSNCADEQPENYSPSVRSEGTASEEDANANGRSSTHQLKSFEIDGRLYEIYYNRKGDVDSIVASNADYAYRVVYTDGRIDSVGTYNGGVLESIHDDFVYDRQGRILSYNYYFRLEGYPHDLAFPTTLAYNQRGQVIRIGSESLAYDNQGNVISGFGASFTYDKGLNPLNGVENLFAIMVEEPFIWEFLFSKHNSTSRTTTSGTITYNNVYDARKRLVSKDNMFFNY